MNQPSFSHPSRKQPANPARQTNTNPESFRIGRVQVYLRNKVWYIRYHERGQRIQHVRLMKQIGRPDITAVKTFRHNFATCLQDANVDPLIRNELLGHSPAGLGMTTRYTQTRPETKQKALLAALQDCESTKFAREQIAASS